MLLNYLVKKVDMKKKTFKIILAILWMIVIFSFSNQKATESTELSDGFIKNTIGKVFKIENKEELDKFITPVRKSAHFFIYLILGILVLNCFESINKYTILYSIIICFLYSISDEIHQLFVIGRSGEIKDVIIDTLGSVLGISLYKWKAARK